MANQKRLFLWSESAKGRHQNFFRTQREISKNRGDGHILVGNDEGIVSHNLNQLHLLPLAYVKRREGNVFTGLSLSVHRGVPQSEGLVDHQILK